MKKVHFLDFKFFYKNINFVQKQNQEEQFFNKKI